MILPLHFTISTTVLCPITLSCYSYQLRVSISYIFVLLLFTYYLVAYTYNRLATNMSCYSYQLRLDCPQAGPEDLGPRAALARPSRAMVQARDWKDRTPITGPRASSSVSWPSGSDRVGPGPTPS